MSDPTYLASMARTWRNLAVHAERPETAFNLCELALIYDRQIEAADERRYRHRRAMPRIVVVSDR